MSRYGYYEQNEEGILELRVLPALKKGNYGDTIDFDTLYDTVNKLLTAVKLLDVRLSHLEGVAVKAVEVKPD